MNIIKKEIGKRIRHFREKAGFETQEDLARALATDQSRVSRWETGTASPGIYKEALLRVLGVSEDQIFGVMSTPPPSSDQPTLSNIMDILDRRLPPIDAADALREITRLSKDNEALFFIRFRSGARRDSG